MEFAGVVGALPDVIKWLGLPGTVVASGALFAVLLVLACFRTGSSHFLFLRLWSLLNGKHPIKDEKLIEFFEKRTALMQFRFFTGYRLRTWPVMHKVIEWSEQNDIDVSEIKACGGYFDAETLTMQEKLPPRWALAGYLFLLALAFCLMFSGVFLVLSNKPLLQFKEGDQRWFFYNKNATVTTLRNSTRFDENDCKSNRDELLTRTRWSKEDVQIACDFLQRPVLEKDFDNALADQRWAAGLAILYGLILSCFFGWTSREAYSARKLSRRIQKKRTANEETVKSSSNYGGKPMPNDIVVDAEST